MATPSLHRIVAHWRSAAADPKTLLSAFEREVQEVTTRVSDDQMEWLLSLTWSNGTYLVLDDEVERKKANGFVGRIAVALRSLVGTKLQEDGLLLFQAILQSYNLPKNLRTKVEAANRLLSKKRKPSPPRTITDIVETYKEFRTSLRDLVALAKASIAQGKSHSEAGSALTAGPFTLVNTGGFSDEVMSNIVEVVKKAADLIQKKRLGKVCYGPIQVTKTLTQADTAAFYMYATDDLYIRANMKKGPGALHTIIHELGHRMEHKFLASKEREIIGIYRDLNTKNFMWRDDRVPERGEVLTHKGKTLYVIGYEAGSRGVVVKLAPNPTDTKSTHSAPVNLYYQLKAQSEGATAPSGAFITDYARRGGPNENFAEMFAFYCMDKLPADQVALLEPVLY